MEGDKVVVWGLLGVVLLENGVTGGTGLEVSGAQGETQWLTVASCCLPMQM